MEEDGGRPLGVLYVVLIFVLALFGGGPWLASAAGWIVLRQYSVLFLAAAAFGVLLIAVYGLIATRKIEFHRMGYNFCTTTLGASLSNWAAQLATTKDTLPGLDVLAKRREFWTFTWMGASAHNVASQRLYFLGSLFFASLLAALFCALQSRAILTAQEQNGSRPGLELLNLAYGGILLVLYIVVLIAKG